MGTEVGREAKEIVRNGGELLLHRNAIEALWRERVMWG